MKKKHIVQADVLYYNVSECLTQLFQKGQDEQNEILNAVQYYEIE